MRYFIVITLWLIHSASGAHSEKLKILYEDRPPYHKTSDDGSVKGLVSGRVSAALQAAGIEAAWLQRSSKGQIKTIKLGRNTACSPGWFKKPEREKFAKFSSPVYQDRPQVIVLRADNAHRFSHGTMAALFADKKLKLGAKLGFSYGGFVDELMTVHSPPTVRTTQNLDGIVRMLLGRRFEYFISAPEEFDVLSQRLGIAGEDIVSAKLTDIPPGNRRYLMCSKKVTDETIRRFNDALAKIP